MHLFVILLLILFIAIVLLRAQTGWEVRRIIACETFLVTAFAWLLFLALQIWNRSVNEQITADTALLSQWAIMSRHVGDKEESLTK